MIGDCFFRKCHGTNIYKETRRVEEWWCLSAEEESTTFAELYSLIVVKMNLNMILSNEPEPVNTD